MPLPIAFLALLHCVAAEDAQANTIGTYLQEQACAACKDLDPEDTAILGGVTAVENAHPHEVILYHALPFYVYTLAWIWHGISNEDLLTWKPINDLSTPYPVAKTPLALRVFSDGHEFPVFQEPGLKLCMPVAGLTSVREMGPGEHLGVGQVRQTTDGGRKILVKYGQVARNYVADAAGCFPLVDIKRESQAKYRKALRDEDLTKNGVENATSFERYLTQLGIWNDADSSTPDHIPGVRERVLSVNLNVFGSWKAGWADCSWDIFRSKGTSFSSFGLGGQVQFLEEIFAQQKTSAELQEMVRKQLQLLVCVAKNRTSEPGAVTGCDELVADMKYLVSCATTADLSLLMSAARPTPESECKKVIHGQGPGPRGECGTDVLLQMILPADLANELAYISGSGGIPDTSFQGESFMTGYNALKNTPSGDNVQARVLLRRSPFASIGGSGVDFVAHSSVFRDAEMMHALAGIATDIRDTVLGHTTTCLTSTSTTTSTTTTTTTAWRSPFYTSRTHPLRSFGILALAAAAVTSLCCLRLRIAAPARDMRAIEMPERV